ncbi:TetR/AcrR family transcriptional regulator [Desulfosporosinus meridiei]|uniref:Transcriptional regulator n=1 Tax=Desulfosporosinus meridiei (strain ATCC BAA-275 / DSM 13257 / KCTC 12902 / NCIMB 13706 / S10) TaxID=768704 RepID=J7INP2_DESMD|nr:TetR/AcrR family transcriptional regulator [Desulfosporosinus meridiei]AFQ43442.1 transcriptional regulator [Desulfosporosinus meridiei DSM 13257]
MENPELKNPQDNTLSLNIIEAARQLFMENGFKGTTTKMIAKTAGVNEATLFRHFKSKEGIFLEISKEITNYSHSRLKSIVQSQLSPEEMFFQFGMELYQRIVESKGVLIVAIIESKKRSELSRNVTKTLKTVIEILEEKLTELYNQGILKENDFFIAALMYVESLIGLFVVQSRLEGELIPVEIERLCRSAAKIFLEGLLNPKAT